MLMSWQGGQKQIDTRPLTMYTSTDSLTPLRDWQETAVTALVTAVSILYAPLTINPSPYSTVFQNETRCVIMNTMFAIMTHDTQRRDKWLKLFGTDQLPVKSAKPRWRVERGAFGREVNVLAYDLDADRLHWMARIQFARYVTVKTGHKHRPSEIDGWLIKAAGCELVTVEENSTADSSVWRKRPFSFAGAAWFVLPAS